MKHQALARLRRSEAVVALALTVGLLVVPTANAQAPRNSNAPIKIGDLVEIRIEEEPSLNLEEPVAEDGTLALPLLGAMHVVGLSGGELAATIREKLEMSYLQRATVSVRVVDHRSQPISVLGAVERPGSLETTGRRTLLQALSDAGGLSQNRGNVIHISRQASNGLTAQMNIDIDRLISRADPSLDIPLQENDVVTVSAHSKVTIYLMGEIAQTGAMTFTSTDRVTLLTVIAQAGGLTKRAASKVTIKRLQPTGTRKELVVSYKKILAGKAPDIRLEDGDLLLVKESFL